ncbi:MAG: DUF362 domain-containing protein [bacterium]
MVSEVFFSALNRLSTMNPLQKLERLLDQSKIESIIIKNDLVAIKSHFGEKGNTTFIGPLYFRTIVKKIKKVGGRPFLTDTNTLYLGSRGEAISHLQTAIENGFVHSVVDASVIIADGLRGNTMKEVEINQKHFVKVNIGAEIYYADSIVSISHFKCHELMGFGGTLKNLGMGCASRMGKLSMHSKVTPSIISEKCIACGNCVKWCPANAISISHKSAVIDEKKCIGCGECIASCLQASIKIEWNESMSNLQEKMVEYVYGTLNNKKGKALFVNFLTQINPLCDCNAYSGTPIVDDIGILVSKDPVAIDQASVDLVNQQEGRKNSALTSNYGSGEDKFRGVYPNIDWSVQIKYAEKIGLGTKKYKLIKLEGC